jgi:hypothetical protein
MAPEDEPTQVHRYYTNDRVDFEFYQKHGRANGLNSGVMLLNLHGLHHGTIHSIAIYKPMSSPYQDLLNIYFAHHPSQL